MSEINNFYKLIYIKGISRFDTWRFENKQAQYDYFDSFTGSSCYRVDDYYPPHYTNSIRFDKREVDYADDKYNYLLLYFSNKYYCYFIDSIEYINEDVYELKLTMDTIQTYMFDIDFLDSIVNKLSIKRFDGNRFNRDYQRINISKCDKILKYYNEYNLYSYCIITSKTTLGAQATITRLYQNGINCTNGLIYYIIPLPNNNLGEYATMDLLIGTTHYTIATNNFVDAIYDASVSPNVIDMIFVKSKFIDENLKRTDSISNQVYQIKLDIYNASSDKIKINMANVGFSNNTVIHITDINNTLASTNVFDFEITKNTSTTKQFGYENVPFVIDENYITLEYGEKSNYSIGKLSKWKSGLAQSVEGFDFTTFGRFYNIIDYYEEYDYSKLKDVYNTKAFANSKEYYDRYTDPWLEYKSQHLSTLSNGLLLQSAKTLMPRGEIDLANTGRKFTDLAFNLGEVLVNKENLESSPDTRNQGNQWGLDNFSNILNPYRAIYVVSDINEVAKQIEHYGYNVNKAYSNQNLFDINNRYYFNVIACSFLNVSPKIIISNELLKNFIMRFQNGLRLWNKSTNTNMFDNLIYDNVENDFIESGGN